MASASLSNPAYQLLLREIEAAGDARTKATTDAILGQCLDTIWGMYEEKALINPRLQYCYAARQVIDFWLKSVWRDVTYEEEVREALSDQAKNLQAMRANLDADIAKLEQEIAAGGSNAFAVGQLTNTSALPPLCTHQPDPAHTIYGGDARYRGMGRRRRGDWG